MKKLKYRMLHYTILGLKLYKKSMDGALLRCLGEAEAYTVVAQMHEGIFVAQ